MAIGDIHYARFPQTPDTNIGADLTPSLKLAGAIFPTTDYEIFDVKSVNISGGTGRMILVCVVFARRLT